MIVRLGGFFMKFVAIDFETANYDAVSACAMGLVRVEHLKIVKKEVFLLKPPMKQFVFSYLHGISWDDVKSQKNFKELWQEFRNVMDGIDFLVAHNSRFDQKVLYALCDYYQLERPILPFECTMKLSRKIWSIRPTKLSDVSRHFNPCFANALITRKSKLRGKRLKEEVLRIL